MNTYLVKWPDSTISIITAKDVMDLCDKIDVESSHTFAKAVFKMPSNFNLQTRLNMSGKLVVKCDYDHGQRKPKRIKLPTGAEFVRWQAGQ